MAIEEGLLDARNYGMFSRRTGQMWSPTLDDDDCFTQEQLMYCLMMGQ